MKHHVNLLYALLFPLFLSCSSTSDETIVPPIDPPSPTPDVTPPASTKWTFNYSLPTQETTATRAIGSDIQFTQLDASNRVGLFCLKSNGTFYFDNLKYKDGADGRLVPDEGVDAPNKYSGQCKIIACAPYSDAFKSLPENITFPVQLDQTTTEGLIASDLLWSEAEVDDQADNVELEFQRVFPRWVLTVSIGGGLQPEDFQGTTLAVYKVLTQIGFNAKTGQTDSNATEQANISFLKIADDNTSSTFVGTVIIPPQKRDACYLQIIFKDGVKRYFKFDPTVFQQGKRYYSDIQLTGYPNDIKANIKSWEEENHEGYIRQE